jgi:hypothetical protein
MRNPARVVCGIAIAVVGLLVAMPRAQACTCLVPFSPADARDASAAVFEGFVLGSTVEPQTSSRTVRLQVMRAWKGVDADTVVSVQTADIGSLCGIDAPHGELMLVYAIRDDAGLRMTLCSRTKPSSFAQEDFAALGAPAQVGELAPGAAGGLVHAGGCAVAGGRPSVAIVSLGLALVIGLRRRRRR